jgi:hypothetical protein
MARQQKASKPEKTSKDSEHGIIVGSVSMPKAGGKIAAGVRSLYGQHRRRVFLSLIAVILVFTGLLSLRIMMSKNEPVSGEQPVGGILSPESFSRIEKSNTADMDASEAEKIHRLTLAANYYANTYQFEKIIEELDEVRREHPAAEEHHFFLTSYFVALFELGRTEDMRTYARLITDLEGRGIHAASPMPPGIREAIDEHAR